jgi:tagatose 1,6-diphosphate aldolase
MNWLPRWLRPPPAHGFCFLDPGSLCDGDLRLALVHKHAEQPKVKTAPEYEFEMRSAETAARLGRISLRIGDSERLRRYVGHVGYFVEPPCRGNRYASRAVRLVLPLAWRHGLAPVWITCNPDNLPSRRSLERAGGIYVETVPVPPNDPLYLQGDVEKCRFRFDPPLLPLQ